MQLRSAALVLLMVAGPCAASQFPREVDPEVRLPSGKLQREEILRADHEKNLEDAAKLVKLAEELRSGLEKFDRHVLSVGLLKQTEEIEKTAKRIRSRMKKY